MQADPDEVADLAHDPTHADVLADMLAEVQRRWDMPRLSREIIASQRRWLDGGDRGLARQPGLLRLQGRASGPDPLRRTGRVPRMASPAR